MRIDFYVIKDEHPEALMRVAARLLEKAHAKGLRTWVICTSDAEAEALDDWLWAYDAASFLPHCLASVIPEGLNPPIQIALNETAPNGEYDILLNLTEALPTHLHAFDRVLDVVAAHQKNSGRQRYKAYQQEDAALYHHPI